MSTGDSSLRAAEYREVAGGRLNRRYRVVYPLAPFLEDDALKRYIFYKRRYPRIKRLDASDGGPGDGNLPPRFEQTQYCQNLVAAHGSPVAQQAIRTGNVTLLSWLTGLTNREADFTGAQLFAQVLHHLRRPGYLGVFAGSTDGGKTNTALMCTGLHLRDNPDAVLVTNIGQLDWREESLNERTFTGVETKSRLLELADEYEDVIVVLDEMSTQANAQTSNYEVNDEFYSVITEKSKRGIRMFVIGHRESGLDIAPAIREHATHFIRQEREEHDLDPDEFRAHFFAEIGDDGPDDKQFTLDPVPEVAASYDPDETATFDLSA